MTETDQHKMGLIVGSLFDAIRVHITPTDGRLTADELDIVTGALGMVTAALFASIPNEYARHKEILLWAATVAAQASSDDLSVPEGVTLQ